jgi:hypothetical protein
MLLPLKVVCIIFSSVFCLVGLLIFVSPAKYPLLHRAFVSEAVIGRETTEQGKLRAIRMQGLMAFLAGAFVAFLVWALM